MTNSDWLALTEEAPLEPELPIVDTHHHFLDRDGGRYLLAELAADAAGHNVRQTVFVECSSMYRTGGPEDLRVVGETEFVQRIATQSASGQYGGLRAASAIVGKADLRLGDRVAAVLEAHMAAAPQRFRGIRQSAAWVAPGVLPRRGVGANQEPRLLLDVHFRRGFAQLARYGLTFDAWVFHPQIPELIDLARSFPDTTIVLNHIGGPIGVGPYAGRRDAVFAEWSSAIAELARCPNVVAKVGGMQMPVNGFGWHERERPPSSDELLEVNRAWYLHVIEQFGPERCMFESNFPVDRASCSYRVLWNQFKRLTASFTPSERSAMFHWTAMRVYRLGQP